MTEEMNRREFEQRVARRFNELVEERSVDLEKLAEIVSEALDIKFQGALVNIKYLGKYGHVNSVRYNRTSAEKISIIFDEVGLPEHDPLVEELKENYGLCFHYPPPKIKGKAVPFVSPERPVQRVIPQELEDNFAILRPKHRQMVYQTMKNLVDVILESYK